jgi:hypothetical protein
MREKINGNKVTAKNNQKYYPDYSFNPTITKRAPHSFK